jgi:hypothetical protein
VTTLVEIEGLSDAALYFKTVPEISAKAASLAINQTLQRGGLNLARKTIEEEIAFPKGYLTGDRLAPKKFAKPNNLEGSIVARKRATSLARFAQGQPLNKPGISVRVGRDAGTTVLRGAWLVRLRQGASLTQDQYNVGLAVRVKPGDKLRNKKMEHKSWLVPGRVALLYGPSVDQVFRQVADEISMPVADLVAAEFFRQFERLSR